MDIRIEIDLVSVFGFPSFWGIREIKETGFLKGSEVIQEWDGEWDGFRVSEESEEPNFRNVLRLFQEQDEIQVSGFLRKRRFWRVSEVIWEWVFTIKENQTISPDHNWTQYWGINYLYFLDSNLSDLPLHNLWGHKNPTQLHIQYYLVGGLHFSSNDTITMTMYNVHYLYLFIYLVI